MYIQRLILQTFRNHSFLDLSLNAQPVVFFGDNGSGKTNILEAISYFSVGKGLRSSKIEDLVQYDQKQWGATLVFQNNKTAEKGYAPLTLSSFYDGAKRTNKIQGEVIKSPSCFGEWISLFWLTPEHDRLWMDSPKIRRRFLDRMVYSYEPSHAMHLVNYEKVMKERLFILKSSFDQTWLSILEEKLAAYAASIAFARQRLLNRIEAHLIDLNSLFPRFRCLHEGSLEETLKDKVLDHEEEQALKGYYRDMFKKTRIRDREAHMTTFGVHRSDFTVRHPVKGKAKNCSTGEQKILLIGFVLSFLISRLKWDEKLLVILLDECVSHFDFAHRMVLFEEILRIQNDQTLLGTLQVFMTGTDRELFKPLEGKAFFHHITP